MPRRSLEQLDVLGNDATHAMCCNRMPHSYQNFRYDTDTDALRNATSRAGISSTREPLYKARDPSSACCGQAMGHVYTILNPGPGNIAIETVVPHPSSASALEGGSAHTPGKAAAIARAASAMHLPLTVNRASPSMPLPSRAMAMYTSRL